MYIYDNSCIYIIYIRTFREMHACFRWSHVLCFTLHLRIVKHDESRVRSTQGWVSAAIWSSSLCEEPGSCSYCEQPVACCYKLRSRQATTRRVIKRSCLIRPGGAGKPGLANSQGLPHAMGGQAPRLGEPKFLKSNHSTNSNSYRCHK